MPCCVLLMSTFGGLARQARPSSDSLRVLLHCPTTVLARIVLDGAGARTLIS